MIKRFSLAILHVFSRSLFENGVGDGIFGTGVHEAVEIDVALLPENMKHDEASELRGVGTQEEIFFVVLEIGGEGAAELFEFCFEFLELGAGVIGVGLFAD